MIAAYTLLFLGLSFSLLGTFLCLYSENAKDIERSKILIFSGLAINVAALVAYFLGKG
jgi:hypothetical protein